MHGSAVTIPQANSLGLGSKMYIISQASIYSGR